MYERMVISVYLTNRSVFYMNILVIGCGKLGARLANTLCHHGHDVSIVDKDEEAFEQLDEDFDGMTVVGMPMDMSVLRNAGVESCDAVAVVTSDDNLNITVSQIVKEFFYVDNVVARITDPVREDVFHQFGLKTICQTNLACSAIYSALVQEFTEKHLHFYDNTVGVNMREIDPIFVGRTVETIPMKTGETIMGVLRETGKLYLYDGRQKIVLNPKDKIIFARIND